MLAMINSEFVKVVASNAVIAKIGIDRRIVSGGIYQNITWQDSTIGNITVCDEKGCFTEIPEAWAQACDDEI